jgi:hypothetical protein
LSDQYNQNLISDLHIIQRVVDPYNLHLHDDIRLRLIPFFDRKLDRGLDATIRPYFV